MAKASSPKQGEAVWLRCAAKQGMLPTENYIRITMPGETVIAGFVPNEDVEGKESKGRVRAVVAYISNGKTALLFRGEILSRTNPVLVSTKSLATLIR